MHVCAGCIIYSVLGIDDRSTWPCGLSRRSEAGWFLGSRVRIPLRVWMFVSCVVMYCVGSGLCDLLITHLEESYRVCMCVSHCVWPRNINSKAAWSSYFFLFIVQSVNEMYGTVLQLWETETLTLLFGSTFGLCFVGMDSLTPYNDHAVPPGVCDCDPQVGNQRSRP
jgi:hypothetical protein